MTLIKFEPLRDLENFTNRIQRFFGEYPALNSDWGISFMPKIDISEDKKSIYVDVEIPGVKKDDLKISLQDNILTISGEKKSENKSEDNEKNYFRTERSYGTFTRSFTLPSEINPDSVDARFEDGVLKIKVDRENPKPVNERLIDIK